MLAALAVMSLPGVALAEAESVEVSKIDGTRVRGVATTWTADGISLRTEDQAVTIAAPQILRVRWDNEQTNKLEPNGLVELTDGTRIPMQAYEVRAGNAEIATPLSEQALTLSTKRVAYVQFAKGAPRPSEIDVDVAGDLLVVRKKNSDGFDHLTGVLGDVGAEQVNFTWDGESIPVKRTKVAALVYFHAERDETAAPVCWLDLQNGARLPVAKIAVEQARVTIQSPGGLKFSFTLDSLQAADYSHGKLTYLSDLKPIQQRWTPRIGLPESAELARQQGLPRRDQSFTGSPLSLRWPPEKLSSPGGVLKTYDKGLAIRSRTQLRYRLPRNMSRFVTVAGIDPLTAKEGRVTLEIFADKQSVWHGDILGGAAPLEIQVELGGAKELRIVVDYGDNLDFGDRLHLAEARFTK